MGRKPRQKPSRLPEKLSHIRASLGLSQNEMIRRLGAEDTLTQNRISDYELGVHEPSLITLLQYARAANVSMEAIVDDELDLPDKLPSPAKSDGIKRKSKRSRR
jgi:transcriptional regulator with XRE-family HTH domain